MKFNTTGKIFGLLVFSLVLLFACSTSRNLKSDPTNELLQLMSGSFNSEQQAEADSSYFNITLHMYPVWQKSDERWLYVEQAVTTAQDRPYRQRMYKLEQLSENTFKSSVYRLAEEEKFIGKYNSPEYFDAFDSSILEERKGCAVYLTRKEKGVYAGSTKEKECESSLRGASYATSIVRVEKGKIESWDQGFDASDNQVWGAVTGGYIFDRIQ